ncbi:MAG TPA: hypothetical protein EYN38_04665 [Flavobacteriales bacterium]|nr:hypothetical protein [Flavobacteriales bacterium]
MNIYEVLKPYGFKILKEQYSVENISDEIFTRLMQLNTFVSTFPYEVNEIMKNLREGKLTIQVDDKETKKLKKKVNSAANRLTLVFLISALLISSAIVMTTGEHSQNEIPMLSKVGFGIALVLSIPLIMGVFRKDED